MNTSETSNTSLLIGNALRESKITRCFGIPGVQNLRLYEKLNDAMVEPVLIANEASAAYLAIGQYQSTGTIGCANVIGGPGITHALPGIEFACRTHSPLLIVTTGCARDEGRSYQLHDVDNLGILGPLCKMTHRLVEHDDVFDVVARLVDAALEKSQGPCALEIPMHLLRGQSMRRQTPRDPGRFIEIGSPERVGDESLLPQAVTTALEKCAIDLGKRGLYVVSDLGHRGIPYLRNAVALAIGASFSDRLPVAITDVDSFVAFAPEFTLAAARQLPVVTFVHSDSSKQAALESVAKIFQIPLLRSASHKDLVSGLTRVLSTSKAVICEMEFVTPQPNREPPAMSTAWLSSLRNSFRESGLSSVFVAADGAVEPVTKAIEAGGLPTRVVYNDQNLGFMADGASRSTGRPVAIVLEEEWARSSVLSGLGESYLDQVPIVFFVIASSPQAHCLGTLRHLSKLAMVVESIEGMPRVLHEAVRQSVALSGPICVICPVVLPNGADRADVFAVCQTESPSPSEAELDAVAQMFVRAKQPVIFVGRGAKGCSAELVTLAHLTGSVVASTLSGKGVFPETDALWLWAGLGPLCPPPIKVIAEACDGCLIIGARLSELGSAHFRARFPDYCFHVDLDPDVPNKMTRALAICADAGSFTRALLAHIRAHYPRFFPRSAGDIRDEILIGHEWVRADIAARKRQSSGVDPYALLETIQALLPAETVFCTDSGNGTIHALEALRLGAPGRFLCPADYNSMGYSVPAALGAAWAQPSVPVVSVVGDGAFLMTGLKSLLTEPTAPPIITVVLRDRRLGMIGDIQKASNRPEVCTRLPEFQLEALSFVPEKLRFFSAATSEEIVECVSAARIAWSEGKSSLVECFVDPDKMSYFFLGAMSAPIVPPPKPVDRAKSSDGPRANIWAILERAKREFGDRMAISDGDKKYSYRELYERASKLALFFRDRGIGSGQVVGVMLRNRVEVIETHFALAALRAVVLNVNVRLAATELQHVFNQSNARWLVSTVDYANALSDVVALGDVRLDGVLWVDRYLLASAPDARLGLDSSYDDVLAEPLGTLEPTPGSEFDAFQLYYTSGTTGFPKGVLLNHRQVFVHAIAAAEEMKITGDDVWGHFSPMYHVVDAFAIYALTWLGGQHVIVSDPDPTNFLRLLAEKGITCTNLAAAAANFLIQSPDIESHDYSRLRILSCGGSALDAKTVRRLIQIFGCEIFMSYGMTECCGKISMSILSTKQRGELSLDQQFELIATSGRVFKRMQIRIVDDQGSDVAADNVSIGEVWIRGATVFTGYYNDTVATREAFQNGWFKTGDLATIRPDGYLTIVGRKKDMIITYGENVYAGEVERVVALHPAVQQVAVYGFPHPVAGELVKAVIRLRHGSVVLSVQELISFCRAHLAAYKVPQEVEFVGEMPMSGSFKIDKLKLKSRDGQSKGNLDDRLISTPRKHGHDSASPKPLMTTSECEIRISKIIDRLTVLGTAQASATSTLWELGLDSILFITLLRELEEEFQLKLEPNFLIQNNTIEKIANSISRGSFDSRASEAEEEFVPPLFNETLALSWEAKITRPLGALESLLYDGNKRGIYHINPLVEVEGHIDSLIMTEAARLLEKRIPYLATSIVDRRGTPVLEYDPRRHIELVFLSEDQAPPIFDILPHHLRDPGKKKILFIRTRKARESYTIVPAIWHCYHEIHGYLRLVHHLFAIYERLAKGAAVDTNPQTLPIAREELFANLGENRGVFDEKDELALKTGQEFIPDMASLQANRFRFPAEKRRKLNGAISFAGGEYRELELDAEATRSFLGVVSRNGSSLTGALSAALCLVARNIACSTTKTHKLMIMGSVDARPLVNLSTDAFGYYATYPKFMANVGPSTEFWQLAKHFHLSNQAYLENRTFARMVPEYYAELASTIQKVHSRAFGMFPGATWDFVTKATRLLAVNLGVLDVKLGDGFSLRSVRVLQDFPSMTCYSYLLEGRLHLHLCSQLPSRVADVFASQIGQRVREIANEAT